MVQGCASLKRFPGCSGTETPPLPRPSFRWSISRECLDLGLKTPGCAHSGPRRTLLLRVDGSPADPVLAAGRAACGPKKGLPQQAVLPNQGGNRAPGRCGTGTKLYSRIQLWFSIDPFHFSFEGQDGKLFCETSELREQSRQQPSTLEMGL